MAALGQGRSGAPSGAAYRGGAGLNAPATWTIRRLTLADLPGYKPLRLKALRDHPEAYGSSFEEEEHDDMARFIGERPSVTLGAYAANAIVATAAFVVPPKNKQRHKGHIVAVYVRPEWRRTGLALDLMRHVIDVGRDEGLTLLTLSVTADNTPARRLYRALGFVTYGCEPSSLLVDGRMWDEELMVLFL